MKEVGFVTAGVCGRLISDKQLRCSSMFTHSGMAFNLFFNEARLARATLGVNFRNRVARALGVLTGQFPGVSVNNN